LGTQLKNNWRIRREFGNIHKRSIYTHTFPTSSFRGAK
jgi:hypothetical protein